MIHLSKLKLIVALDGAPVYWALTIDFVGGTPSRPWPEQAH